MQAPMSAWVGAVVERNLAHVYNGIVVAARTCHGWLPAGHAWQGVKLVEPAVCFQVLTEQVPDQWAEHCLRHGSLKGSTKNGVLPAMAQVLTAHNMARRGAGRLGMLCKDPACIRVRSATHVSDA